MLLSETHSPSVDPHVFNLTGPEKWAFAWIPKSQIAVVVDSSSPKLCSAVLWKADHTFIVHSDRAALDLLRRDSAPVQPIGALSSHLPFSSNSVDTILLIDVLGQTDDEVQVVNEIQRVLRTGGKCILSIPYKGLFRFRGVHSSETSGTSFSTTPYRRYSDDDLTRLLFWKFRILERHYGGLFLYPLAGTANSFVQRHFHWNWGRFFTKIQDIDNDISWRKWSCNLIMLVEKI